MVNFSSSQPSSPYSSHVEENSKNKEKTVGKKRLREEQGVDRKTENVAQSSAALNSSEKESFSQKLKKQRISKNPEPVSSISKEKTVREKLFQDKAQDNQEILFDIQPHTGVSASKNPQQAGTATKLTKQDLLDLAQEKPNIRVYLSCDTSADLLNTTVSLQALLGYLVSPSGTETTSFFSSLIFGEWQDGIERDESGILRLKISGETLDEVKLKALNTCVRLLDNPASITTLPLEDLLGLIDFGKFSDDQRLIQRCENVIDSQLSSLSSEQVLEILNFAEENDLPTLAESALRVAYEQESDSETKQNLAMQFAAFVTDIGRTLKIQQQDLTDAGVQFCCAHFPNLKVNLSGNTNVTLENVQFPETLREIDISSCPNITQENFTTALEPCTTLEKIVIRNTSLSLNGHQFPETLREIVISNCPNVTQENFTTALERCDSLEKIVISGAPFSLKGCHFPETLREIDISNCPNITQQDLEAPLQKCTHLEKVMIRGSSLTLENFQFPQTLKHVAISNCKNISSLQLAESLKNCREIEEVSLHQMSCTLAECQFPATLKAISLSECTNITDTDFKKALQNCSKLEKVSIQYVPSLSLDEIPFSKSVVQLTYHERQDNTEKQQKIVATCSKLRLFNGLPVDFWKNSLWKE